MTGTLKSALALSVGVHASLLLGWPATTAVEFDVERAPTSLEIRLVAPRAAPAVTALQPAIEPSVIEERPEAAAEAVQSPEPVPETIITPEVQGALGEVLPGYLRNPAPVYPTPARQRGDEGTVLLQAEVLPIGRCGRLTVLVSSGSALLDEAAAKAVKRWQFKPARRGGEPVAVWVEIPVTFRLVDGGRR